MAWGKITAQTQSWTTLTKSGFTWAASGTSLGTGVRPNHAYPTKGDSGINFLYRLSSEFPFYLASEGAAVISSGITQGAP